MKQVIYFLTLLGMTMASNSDAQEARDEPRLLRPPEIYLPGQEYRLHDDRWLSVAQDLGAAQPSLAAPKRGLNQEVAFGASTRNESFSQLQQSMAVLPSGGYAVVWVEGDFPERDVRMQWLDPEGEKLFEPEGRIIAGMAGFEEANAVVAPHAEAGALVAFSRGVDGFNDNIIYAQSFDAAGVPRWPGDGVRVGISDNIQRTPHLVPDPAGGAYVCWTEGPAGLETIAPWCQHLSSTGERMWGDSGLLAGGQSGLRVLPRGVLDDTGGLLIFWRNQRDVFDSTAEPMLMEGQHFTADGTKLWGASGLLVRTTNLAETNSYGLRFYNVVSDGSGGALLGFDDWVEMDAFNLDVVAQRVSGDGTLLWGDFASVAIATDFHIHEATIAAPDGGAFVVARESISGTRSRLWLYRLGSDGMHQWPTAGYELSDPDGTALEYGALGAFDGGLLRLVWIHQQAPATFEMDVQYARYTPAGTRLDEPAGYPVTTVADAQFVHGFAYSSTAGQSLAVWDDRRKGTWEDLDVYGSLFLPGAIFADGFESGDTSAWSMP